eukprot:COSAG05_NODE_1793_length_4082_cov_2.602310_1_plen_28_part_10
MSKVIQLYEIFYCFISEFLLQVQSYTHS